MNKKFFTQLFAFFLTLIIIGFSETPSSVLAMESEEDSLGTDTPNLLHLNRMDDNKKMLLEYTDNLKLAGSNFIYNLNFPIDDELTREAYDYGQDEPFSQGRSNPKSHLLVNSFDIYKKNNSNSTFIEYEPLTTKTFYQVGIGEKNTDIKIDWMSNLSQLDDEDDVVRCRSDKGISKLNAGHSEPQLIWDIKKLFTESKKDVVNFFIPRPTKRKNSTVLMYGLELYGSFDICDHCLSDIVEFRQWGKENISQVINNKLGYSINAADSFVIIYHTLNPYAEATYQTKHEGRSYKMHYVSDTYLEYGKTCQIKSHKAFKVTGMDNCIDELQSTALIQENKVDIDKNIIYGQIHNLYNQKGIYQQKHMGSEYAFSFRGQSK